MFHSNSITKLVFGNLFRKSYLQEVIVCQWWSQTLPKYISLGDTMFMWRTQARQKIWGQNVDLGFVSSCCPQANHIQANICSPQKFYADNDQTH